MWRGQPLEGVSTNSCSPAERARLEEERLAAVIEGIELDLELGRHGELLGQLEALVIAHPLKERLVELQMLALYRCGRQADALAAYRRPRAVRRGARHRARTAAARSARGRPAPRRHAPATPRRRRRPAAGQPGALGDRRLPAPPNRTIGREHELDAVGERLRAGLVRLLTLTGPGRGRQDAARARGRARVERDFADGARFVSLAAVSRPEDVPAAIVGALGIIVLAGRVRRARRSNASWPPSTCCWSLDNFEHLLGRRAVHRRLLERLSRLTVLATSREPLALQAEERYPVPPLALPERGAPEDRRRWPTWTPSRCSASAREPTTRRST